MARIQIPIDALTSQLNLGERFNNVRSVGIMQRFQNIRPVSEFFDLKRLSKPQGFGEVQSRVNYNLGYFSSNYALIVVMLFIYTLLTNWWLLFDIIFITAGLAIIRRLDGADLQIGTFRATTAQLYTGLIVIAIPLTLMAGFIGAGAWLIGASGLVVLGHASFMEKPIDEAFSGEVV